MSLTRNRIASIVFVVNTLVAILIGWIVLGYDSYTSSVNTYTGWTELVKAFGGLTSFRALIALLVLAAAVVVIITVMADHPSVPNWGAGVVALLFVAIALRVGNKWIQLPSGAGWILLLFVVLIAAQTTIVMYVSRRNLATTS